MQTEQTFKITTEDGVKRTLKVCLAKGQIITDVRIAAYKAGLVGRITSASVQLQLDAMTLAK